MLDRKEKRRHAAFLLPSFDNYTQTAILRFEVR